MGSAIECFDNAGAVVVPRERFAPVKTTNDLFLLRSDVYKVLSSCCCLSSMACTMHHRARVAGPVRPLAMSPAAACVLPRRLLPSEVATGGHSLSRQHAVRHVEHKGCLP